MQHSTSFFTNGFAFGNNFYKMEIDALVANQMATNDATACLGNERKGDMDSVRGIKCAFSK